MLFFDRMHWQFIAWVLTFAEATFADNKKLYLFTLKREVKENQKRKSPAASRAFGGKKTYVDWPLIFRKQILVENTILYRNTMFSNF